MNTKKFYVEYASSRLLYGEFELQAHVTTDKASHYCRLRKGPQRANEKVWPDQGREYTPTQEAMVMALFVQVEPDVIAAVDKYLVDHNYPTHDKLTANKLAVYMNLDVEHQVREIKVEYRS